MLSVKELLLSYITGSSFWKGDYVPQEATAGGKMTCDFHATKSLK
jgi:hypothetical protein